jgi:hypothetical protein
VERLPDLCRPHAQRTKRLQEALRHLGLSMGGQRGADVGSEHGINGSRDTILRLVHQSEPPARSEPRVIGLDDWAWKRKRRYGTLICDLEQGLPIDLLAVKRDHLPRKLIGSSKVPGVACVLGAGFPSTHGSRGA